MENHLDTAAMDPNREVRVGSHRKTPEINGTWKQYSGRKFFGPFSGEFRSIPVHFGKKRPEIIWKKSETISGWNTASVFR